MCNGDRTMGVGAAGREERQKVQGLEGGRSVGEPTNIYRVMRRYGLTEN